MADPLADWWVHTASAERISGSGAGGDTLDAPEDVVGFWNDGTKLVRDQAGNEVVSSAQFAYPATVARIPAGSFVTEPPQFGTARRRVIVSALGDAGDMPVPTHYELALE